MIAFDIDASVNFEGDSGPYLLYSYARAKSVLRKAGLSQSALNTELSDSLRQNELKNVPVNTEERDILRRLMYFPEIVNEAAVRHAPSLICNYLFELAQSFNLFYAKHSILGGEQKSAVTDEQKNFRLELTSATAQILKKGLYLLGIDVLEKM